MKPNLDPIALRHQFMYNPTTGRIRPKPTPTWPNLITPVQVRNRYWRVDHTTNIYAEHRIIWALHHPEYANPKHVACNDWDTNNIRIENLIGTDSWPPKRDTDRPPMPTRAPRETLFGTLERVKRPPTADPLFGTLERVNLRNSTH